jgi:predicted kinase
VICDNTNIRAREYNKYVEIAKKRGYLILAVVFYPDDIEQHNKRNTHHVPIEVLSKMKDNLLHNFQTVGADDEYVIYPAQGGPGSERVKNVINRILKK